VIGLAFALWIGWVRFGNGNAIENAVAGSPLDDIALAAIFAAPALVGLFGIRRPALLLAAGVACGLMAFSPLIVTFALIVPAVLFIVAFSRTGAELAGRDIAAVVVTVGLFLAGPVLFLTGSNETVCWTEIDYPDGTSTLVRNAAEERDMADGSGSSQMGVPAHGGTSSGGGCTTGAITATGSISVLAAALGAVVAGPLIATRDRGEST
jgi:hypothetical protein